MSRARGNSELLRCFVWLLQRGFEDAANGKVQAFQSLGMDFPHESPTRQNHADILHLYPVPHFGK